MEPADNLIERSTDVVNHTGYCVEYKMLLHNELHILGCVKGRTLKYKCMNDNTLHPTAHGINPCPYLLVLQVTLQLPTLQL